MRLFKKLLLCVGLMLGVSVASAQIMPTISDDTNTVWYYIQFKNGSGVMQDMGNNTNILTKAAVKDKAEQLWKITGTTDSYVFTSKTGRKINFQR